jgi:hypothetical protein
MRTRFSASIATLILATLYPLLSGGNNIATSHLYLLSATPTEHTDKTYPAILYSSSPDKKLKFIREVVSTTDGVRSVQGWGDVIFIIHPHVVSTALTVVHMNEPMVVDDVLFNRSGLVVGDVWVTVASAQESSISELVPLLQDASNPAHIRGTLASISSRTTGAPSRVKLDGWDEYSALRREGTQGGPAIVPYLISTARGDSLEVSVFGHSVVVDTLSAPIRAKVEGIAPAIVAVNDQYLVIEVQYATKESLSAELPAWTEMFAHDRARAQWKTIRVEGNASRCRLFGSWLTTIVGMRNPDHQPGPGRKSERSRETDRLPNVQEQYSIFAGKWVLAPGILVLQNLADGRKIRIETGQEDSEILRVEGETVLYRVNDTIYQAKIVGDQIKDAIVIVKDEDVPEIHWAFWSK